MEDRVIHISTKTILKIVGIGILLYCSYLIRQILLILFVSLIFSALIDPFAQWFQMKKIPRALAVIVIYILFFSLVGVVLFILAPVITHDAPALFENMTSMWNKLQLHPLWQQLFGTPSTTTIGSLPKMQSSPLFSGNTFLGVYNRVLDVFGGLFSFVLVLVITFYMVVQDDPVRKILHSLVPEKYIPYTMSLVRQIREKLGAWMRGQLALSVLVGCMVFVGLSILRVPYAAVIALVSALFEFVPYIGPVFAAIPGLFFAFGSGGISRFLLVLVLYIVVQQIENHVLAPKVMQKAVGLNPIVSIIAILVGMQIAGVLGALLAIPVATSTSVIIQSIFDKKYEV